MTPARKKNKNFRALGLASALCFGIASSPVLAATMQDVPALCKTLLARQRVPSYDASRSLYELSKSFPTNAAWLQALPALREALEPAPTEGDLENSTLDEVLEILSNLRLPELGSAEIARTPPRLEDLQHTDWLMRALAARRLAKQQTRTAIPALLMLCGDPKLVVRWQALKTMGEILRLSPADYVLPDLKPVIQALSDQGPLVRVQAMLLLIQTGPWASAAIPGLMTTALDLRESSYARILAGEALACIDQGSPRSVPVLKKLMRDPNYDISMNLAGALRDVIPDIGVEVIAEGMQASNDVTRRFAAQNIKYFGLAEDQLKSPQSWNRVLRPARTIQRFRALAAKPIAPLSQSLLCDPSRHVRHEAAESLDYIMSHGKISPEEYPLAALATAMKDPEPYNRQFYRQVLSKYGTPPPTVIPALRLMVWDDDERRLFALEMLGRIHTREAERAKNSYDPLLMQKIRTMVGNLANSTDSATEFATKIGAPIIPTLCNLAGTDLTVAGRASEALRALAKAHPRDPMWSYVLLRLSDCVRSSKPDMRAALAEALGTLKIPELTNRLSSEDELMRLYKTSRYITKKRFDQNDVSTLLHMADDEEAIIRAEVLEVLVSSWKSHGPWPGITGALPKVTSMLLSDPDTEVRLAASRLLGAMGEASGPTVPMLVTAYNRMNLSVNSGADAILRANELRTALEGIPTLEAKTAVQQIQGRLALVAEHHRKVAQEFSDSYNSNLAQQFLVDHWLLLLIVVPLLGILLWFVFSRLTSLL